MSTMFLPTFSVLVFVTFLATASGSSLVIEKEPAVVITPFTKAVTIVCSVHETDISPASAVKNMTKIKEDISSVNSMVLYRQTDTIALAREYLAVVSASVPARPMTNNSHLTVTGNVSRESDQHGYLKLVWDRPEEVQGGKYVCEMSTIHYFVLTKLYSVSTTVEIQSADIHFLVNRVFQLENELAPNIDELNNKTEHLQNALETKTVDLNNLNNRTERLQNETERLQNETERLQNAMETKTVELNNLNNRTEHLQNALETKTVEMNNLNDKTERLQNALETKTVEMNNLNDKTEHLQNALETKTVEMNNLNSRTEHLEKKTDELSHVEYGMHDCARGGGLTKPHIQFSKPFNKTPRVLVTGVRREWDNKDQIYYNSFVYSANTTGFIMSCYANDFTRLEVVWLALPTL